jgi:hypothetical protein
MPDLWSRLQIQLGNDAPHRTAGIASGRGTGTIYRQAIVNGWTSQMPEFEATRKTMQSSTIPITSRRSSRVPTAMRILVTSLTPEAHFSEICETLVVSAHGCAMQSPARLEAGVPVQFHTKDGRETTGYVVDCQPIGSDERSWRLGATLDRPENFWGLKTCPEDWISPGNADAGRQHSSRKPAETVRPPQKSI